MLQSVACSHFRYRLFIRSSHPDGPQHTCTETTTISSARPCFGSLSSWLSCCLFSLVISLRHTRCPSCRMIWIAHGTSTNSTRITTSRRTDMVASRTSASPARGNAVSADTDRIFSMRAGRTCRLACVPLTAGSTSRPRRTASRCSGYRAICLSDTKPRRCRSAGGTHLRLCSRSLCGVHFGERSTRRIPTTSLRTGLSGHHRTRRRLATDDGARTLERLFAHAPHAPTPTPLPFTSSSSVPCGPSSSYIYTAPLANRHACPHAPSPSNPQPILSYYHRGPSSVSTTVSFRRFGALPSCLTPLVPFPRGLLILRTSSLLPAPAANSQPLSHLIPTSHPSPSRCLLANSVSWLRIIYFTHFHDGYVDTSTWINQTSNQVYLCSPIWMDWLAASDFLFVRLVCVLLVRP